MSYFNFYFYLVVKIQPGGGNDVLVENIGGSG